MGFRLPWTRTWGGGEDHEQDTSRKREKLKQTRVMKDEEDGGRIDDEVAEDCRKCRRRRMLYRDTKVPDSLDRAFGDTTEPEATDNDGAVDGGTESKVPVSEGVSKRFRKHDVRITFRSACQPQLLRH